MVVALAAVLLFGLRPASHQEPRPPNIVTIDGRDHPELIPAVVTWETVFRSAWLMVTEDGIKPSRANVDALARLNMHMPVEDVETFLKVAKATLDKVADLRAPLDKEHETGVSLGWSEAARKARQAEVREVIIDGRDSLACRLSEHSFKTLKAWVERTIVPGIQVDVYGK
jgi:hypothetical protein